VESMKFDSLRYERELREVGVPEKQAEVFARTMADACGFWATNIVTKEYLDVKLEALMASIDKRFAEQDARFEKRFHRIDLKFYTLLVFVVLNSVGGVPALLRVLPL